MLIGYARVSTNEQETGLQLDAFKRAGVEIVFTEKTSSVGVRPQLRALLARLKPGDVVTVYKLDRLGRSLQDLLSILDRIELSGARFRSLTEAIDTATATGKLTYSILGAVAEFERSIIRERTLAGQAAARDRGAKFGRPAHLTLQDRHEVRALLERGYTPNILAELYGVNPWTIRRVRAGDK